MIAAIVNCYCDYCLDIGGEVAHEDFVVFAADWLVSIGATSQDIAEGIALGQIVYADECADNSTESGK